MSDGGLDITVCIPVYNDAASGRLLLQELDRVAASLPHRFQVLFVDDGSTEEECRALPGPSERIAAVEVLRLHRYSTRGLGEPLRQFDKLPLIEDVQVAIAKKGRSAAAGAGGGTEIQVRTVTLAPAWR